MVIGAITPTILGKSAVFRWITSGRAFAMGPSRANPMTGEILDADIVFDDAYVSYRFGEHAI